MLSSEAHNWYKKTIEGKPIEPYRVFLSGPDDVGNPMSDTLKFLRLSEPDDVIMLLAAPTGVTAFNIKGMTL